MKYIELFENKNTMNWYGKSLSKDNDKEKFEKLISHILSADIEDFRMVEFAKDCSFYVFTTKSEKQKKFKLWGEVSLWRVQEMTKLGTEIEDVEEFLNDLEFKSTVNKYNL